MVNWRAIAEWAGFQAVWLSCALGAAGGRSSPGVLAAAAYVGAVLIGRPAAGRTILVILASGAAGLVAETALAAAGLVRYSAAWPGTPLAPAWILALWLAFGATVPAIGLMLGRGRLMLAAVLGLVSGPLAYSAGARLGALELAGSGMLSLAAISMIWGIALPILLHLQDCSKDG